MNSRKMHCVKWQRKNLKKARTMAKVKIKVKATVKKTKRVVDKQRGDGSFISKKTSDAMKRK